jgi:hypothetical protein
MGCLGAIVVVGLGLLIGGPIGAIIGLLIVIAIGVISK